MAKPRLIFVNRVYRPSTQATAQLLTDLAEGLVLRLPGWEVHVIATGENSGPQHGVTVHRTGPDEPVSGLISRALTHQLFFRAARQQLLPLLQPGDIVVPMTDPPMLAAAIAHEVAAAGAQLVPWIQDIYPEIAAVHFGPLARFFLSPLMASRDAAWHTAATCVTLGEDMARTVASRGLPADRIAVMPNWAPGELHVPATPAAVAACRQRWGVTDKFVVAYSGNLGRVHEFSTILQAAEVLQTNASLVFLFIGHGARFDEISAAARARRLGNVRLLPPESREDLAASLAAADAHLVTLRPKYSSLVYPSKLAGVLAVGRPVLFVGPPGTGIPQLLQRENCGAAFAPGDAAGLAAAIIQWQAEANLRARLGAAARASYEHHFTAEAALAAWAALLRRLRAGPA